MKTGPASAEVLVLSRDAVAYADALAAAGISAAAFGSADEAVAGHEGQRIVLGEPALVAAALPRLRGVEWVQSTWAGVTPLLDAARGGIRVTGVRGVFGTQMAEYALGYMLAHELGLFSRRRWQYSREWCPKPSGRLSGKTLGVMGTGSIGREVALRADGFGMRLRGYSRGGARVEPFESVYCGKGLHEFLALCDYVVAALPDTPETRGLMDAAAFEAMAPGSVFMNVGRGTLVDEAALLLALENGSLGGAVLDDFREEPLPPSSPLWRAPGLLVTAHVAAISEPRDIARVFLDNYRRFHARETLEALLDPERGY